jgi:hypothetical protein
LEKEIMARTACHLGLAMLALALALASCNRHPMVRRTEPEVVVDGPDGGLLLDAATDHPDGARPRNDASDGATLNGGLELLSWIQSVGGTPIRVLKNGQYVYLGDWENKVQPALSTSDQDGSAQTYDVADPRRPARKSTLFSPGHQMQDLAIDGRWLYAANDLLGLRLVDIAQPDALRSVATWVNPSPIDSRLYATAVAAAGRGTGAARQVHVFVGYLYRNGLDIHLVPDGGPIGTPVHYSSAALPSRCDVHQVLAHDDRAYLLASDGSSLAYVEILDLSTLPAVPTVLGRLALPMANHGGIGDIRVSDGLLYFAASDYNGSGGTHVGGLRIIDVRDSTRPTLVGSLDLPPHAGAIPWKGTGLAVSGNGLFFITPTAVQWLDVSVPAQPRVHATAALPTAFGICQGGTAVTDGDLLYVGAYCSPPEGLGGLAIYRW